MTVFSTTLTCPHCDHSQQLKMGVTDCLHFYQCQGCNIILTKKHEDCCVLSSYATPPVELQKRAGPLSSSGDVQRRSGNIGRRVRG